MYSPCKEFQLWLSYWGIHGSSMKLGVLFLCAQLSPGLLVTQRHKMRKQLDREMQHREARTKSGALSWGICRQEIVLYMVFQPGRPLVSDICITLNTYAVPLRGSSESSVRHERQLRGLAINAEAWRRFSSERGRTCDPGLRGGSNSREPPAWDPDLSFWRLVKIRSYMSRHHPVPPHPRNNNKTR